MRKNADARPPSPRGSLLLSVFVHRLVPLLLASSAAPSPSAGQSEHRSRGERSPGFCGAARGCGEHDGLLKQRFIGVSGQRRSEVIDFDLERRERAHAHGRTGRRGESSLGKDGESGGGAADGRTDGRTDGGLIGSSPGRGRRR